MRLAAARPDIKFTIVGGSDEEIKSAKSDCLFKATENLFFAGFVPPNLLQRYYLDFTVMLAPYEARTDHIQWISPMKLFEYMAHGKPVICSDFPVLREIVEHGVTGYLVASEKLDAWLYAIDRFSSSPQLVQFMGEKAYRNYLENHTWTARGQKILNGLIHE